MSEQIAFELVSPVKKLLGKPVTMVSMPGSEGDFSVLPGHVPLIATLRPGIIEAYEGNNITDRIFVAGGFAEVTGERCTVLAQEAVPVAELNRAAVNENIASINAALKEADSEAERTALQNQLDVAQAKLAVLAA